MRSWSFGVPTQRIVVLVQVLYLSLPSSRVMLLRLVIDDGTNKLCWDVGN